MVGINFDSDSSSFSLSDVDNCRIQPFMILLDKSFWRYNSPTNLENDYYIIRPFIIAHPVFIGAISKMISFGIVMIFIVWIDSFFVKGGVVRFNLEFSTA